MKKVRKEILDDIRITSYEDLSEEENWIILNSVWEDLRDPLDNIFNINLKERVLDHILFEHNFDV